MFDLLLKKMKKYLNKSDKILHIIIKGSQIKFNAAIKMTDLVITV